MKGQAARSKDSALQATSAEREFQCACLLRDSFRKISSEALESKHKNNTQRASSLSFFLSFQLGQQLGGRPHILQHNKALFCFAILCFIIYFHRRGTRGLCEVAQCSRWVCCTYRRYNYLEGIQRNGCSVFPCSAHVFLWAGKEKSLIFTKSRSQITLT